MPPSLEELFQRFLADGDERALEVLLRRCAPTLRRRARRLGAQADEADDLVQETIIAAIQGADRYDSRRPLLPWLLGILTFRSAQLAREQVRRRQALAAPPTTSTDPVASAVHGNELDADVRAAIGRLPEPYREPVHDYLLAESSPLEIAARLGVQRATVRVRLFRGLGRLREMLSRWSGLLLAVLLGRTASPMGTDGLRGTGPGAPPWRRPAAGPSRHDPSHEPLLGNGLHRLRTSQAITSGRLVAAVVLGLGLWLAAVTQPPASVAPPAAPTDVAQAGLPAPRDDLGAATNGESARSTAAVGDLAEAELVVRVVDRRGQPVPRVGIVVTPANGRDPVLFRRRAVTDAQGEARVAGGNDCDRIVACDRSASTAVAAGARLAQLTVADGHELRGRVVDAAGAPVADAHIWLGDADAGPWRGNDVARSDADGRFLLTHVAAGSFVAARHDTLARSEVAAVAALAGDELLLQLGAPVAGADLWVRDPQGRPVADALVFVGDAADAGPVALAQGAATWRAPPYERRSDANGRVRTPAVSRGEQPFAVRAPGFTPAAGWARFTGEATVPLEVVLQPGARLRGRVVDDVGAAVPHAVVVLRGDDTTIACDERAAADGSFCFDTAPLAPVEVAARAAGYLASVTSTIAGPATPPLQLVLRRCPSFGGRFSTRVAVAGARVRAEWPPSPLAADHEHATVAADGSFQFVNDNEAPPRLWLQLAGEPLFRRIDDFTTWRGPEATVSLPADFAADAHLVGSLRDADGRAIAGARLFVRPHGGPWAEIGRSDRHGSFALGPLPAGSIEWYGETTHPRSPTLRPERVDLLAGTTLRREVQAPPAGTLQLELTRGDGAPLGDLAITIVDVAQQRRAAMFTAARTLVTLLPGDYELFVMGSRVAWVAGRPFRVDAGTVTALALTLPPATLCTLVLRGLPPTRDAALQLQLTPASGEPEPRSFTLAPGAPARLAAVLPAGGYRLQTIVDGELLVGTLTVPATLDRRPIVVQLAPQ
ncbi:MAG: sigma-70 family RNA polymerase sigma factor [Planctomycetes bacterium]|nr:sigma-70 family RNA polymerase sigma factor [Planctomycetota bacterium]